MPQYGMPVYTAEELFGPSYRLVTFAWFSPTGKACCSGIGMGTEYPCHCSVNLRSGKRVRYNSTRRQAMVKVLRSHS